MRLVPLNTRLRQLRRGRRQETLKLILRVLFAKEKRCGAPLPTALHKTFFGLRRQSEATTALFPHALPGRRETRHFCPSFHRHKTVLLCAARLDQLCALC
jgi:hypothetical protein